VAEIRDATWDDFEAVFALLDARSRAAFGISQQKAEHLRQAWGIPGTGRWVAVAGGRVVGYAQLEESHDVVHAALDPDVGDALFAHVEQQARVREFDHVAVTAVPEDVPLYDAVRRNGYVLDREILRMWRPLKGDLPEPTWPHGVRVRTYAPDDAHRVHELLDATYAGWDRDYVPRSHDGWVSFMTDDGDDFDPALWFLVERDGELVACALYWKETDRRGWLKDLVVQESERGRGLGTALLHHGFRAYAARGADRVGLKVDSTNPTGAPRLYERVGFVTDQRYGSWQKRL
jgi:mycothiol synthase